MSLEELIDQVNDKESFIKFLDSIIADCQVAEKMERENPVKHQWGGANNWQNSSISCFLESAREYLEEGLNRHVGTDLNWKDLAVFLYFGKIYE